MSPEEKYILLMEAAYTTEDKNTYYKLMQKADQVLKDRACAVGRHQDLQLRSAPPTRADDSAADAAAQRDRSLGDRVAFEPPAAAIGGRQNLS